VFLRTSNLSEAIDAVSRLYCPHEVEICGGTRSISVTLDVVHRTAQPIVALKYSAPVKIRAGNFPNLMLMMTCLDGSATAAQAGSQATWHRNQTVPLSPGLDSRLEFDRLFAHRSVRLDIERLETLCIRWLNAPITSPLRFELHPFCPELEAAWTEAVAMMLKYERMNIVLPPAAVVSFDEFMLALALSNHPHNYSDELQRPGRAAAPRFVREAEYWMHSGGPELTVSAIAARVGVSLRSLEAGFRDWHQSTPTGFLRQIRLKAARTELLSPSESTTVTSAALRNGFFHLARFSARYRAAFGEPPGQTLRRSRLKRR
jgi:AraC-like DNA-binding protein